MPARDPQDRQHAPGPPPDVGAVEDTVYGSGRWGGSADSRSRYSGPTSTGQQDPGSAAQPPAPDLEGPPTAAPQAGAQAETPEAPPSPVFPPP